MTKQLGEKQIAWIREKYGKAFFRDPNNLFFIKSKEKGETNADMQK